MLTFKKLINKPKKLKQFSSLSPEQFSLLVERLSPLWQEAEKQRLDRPTRKRGIGAGRRYKVETMEDKLLLVLMHYRFYTTHDLLGLIFDIDASNVSRMVTKMRPLLEQAADPDLKGYLKEAAKGRKKIRTGEEFVEQYPDLAEVITDATEQQVKRPKGKRKQRKQYSGKKKRHTIKTQLTVSKDGKILDVSRSYPGKVHDKKMMDTEKTIDRIPKESKHFLDKGYDGLPGDHPGYDIRLPHKKRRNKPELSRGEKQANTLRSKRRIIGENVIAKLKKYQILAQVYRSNLDDYNQTFRNISALTNFRLATAHI
jgi:hypothetical protein